MALRDPDPINRPSKITVPLRANPLAKLVFAEMARQGFTYAELEWRAGVLISTIKSWRNGVPFRLVSIEAALGALGWTLAPVQRSEPMPAWVDDELEKILQKWREEEPLLHHLLADVCSAPIPLETYGAAQSDLVGAA